MKTNKLLRWLRIFSLGSIFLPMGLGDALCQLPAAQLTPAIVIAEGKTSQGFPYLFGGVGTDEREALEERAKGFNVKLIFAEKHGSFVSGVTVAMATAKGAAIIALKTEGPWFYIQLPPGEYSVKATFNGETKQIKNLTVPKDKKVQHGLVWDLGEI